MKRKLNFNVLAILAAFVLVFATVGCKDDPEEVKPLTSADLDALIVEAETLLTGAVEGEEDGNYIIGSKATLQSVVDWAKAQKESATTEKQLSDAATRLKEALDTFKASVFKLSIPWIIQGQGSHIELTGKAYDVVAGGAFTMEGKFHVQSWKLNGYEAFFFGCLQGNGGDRGWGASYRGEGMFNINVRSQTSDWQRFETAEGLVDTNDYIHVTFVWDGTNQILYVDGTELLNEASSYEVPSTDWPVTIGNSAPWLERAANALVKDVRMWSKALTASEIDTYMDKVEGTEEGLEVYFPLNTDLGESFKDQIGNSTATFKGYVEWMEGGIPVITIDYTELNATIAEANTFLGGGLTEGTSAGNFAIGTTEYLQPILDEAEDLVDNAETIVEVGEMNAKLEAALDLAKENKVTGAAQGLDFDITTDMVGFLIEPFGIPNDETGFTFEVEINIKELFNPDGTLVYLFGDGNLQFRYAVSNDKANPNADAGKIEFYTYSDAGNWQAPATNAGALTEGTWIQVAGVYDAANDSSSIYIDGVFVAGLGDIPSPSNYSWGAGWLGNFGGNGNRIYGQTREVRYWTKALTEAELHQTLNGDEANLEFYFPLNVASGKIFKDETGKHFGHLRGVTWVE